MNPAQNRDALVWMSDAFSCGLQALRARLLATASTEQKFALCDAIFAFSHGLNCIDAAARACEGGDSRDSSPAPKRPSVAWLAGASRNEWAEHVAHILARTAEIEPVSPDCNSVIRWAIKEAANAVQVPWSVPASTSSFGGIDFAAANREESALVPSFPARERPAAPSSGSEGEGRATMLSRLHRQIFGIEVTAAEICAAVPLSFGPFPRALDHALAIQTFEEGRHARMFADAFLRRGGRFEDHAYPTDIWQAFMHANGAAEALYIEHVLGEGYSIGSDFFLAKFYEDRGEADLASIYRCVAADELMHAQQGLVWFRRIAGTQAEEIEARLQGLASPVPGNEWFFPELRRLVGFSEDEIEYQRSVSICISAPF